MKMEEQTQSIVGDHVEHVPTQDSANPDRSAGEAKVDEYVERILQGESKEAIFEGLSDSFRITIEDKLAARAEEADEYADTGVPPQYKGLDAEIVEMIWTIPEYIDPEKTKKRKMWKARVVAALREKERAALLQQQQ